MSIAVTVIASCSSQVESSQRSLLLAGNAPAPACNRQHVRTTKFLNVKNDYIDSHWLHDSEVKSCQVEWEFVQNQNNEFLGLLTLKQIIEGTQQAAEWVLNDYITVRCGCFVLRTFSAAAAPAALLSFAAATYCSACCCRCRCRPWSCSCCRCLRFRGS